MANHMLGCIAEGIWMLPAPPKAHKDPKAKAHKDATKKSA